MTQCLRQLGAGLPHGDGPLSPRSVGPQPPMPHAVLHLPAPSSTRQAQPALCDVALPPGAHCSPQPGTGKVRALLGREGQRGIFQKEVVKLLTQLLDPLCPLGPLQSVFSLHSSPAVSLTAGLGPVPRGEGPGLGLSSRAGLKGLPSPDHSPPQRYCHLRGETNSNGEDGVTSGPTGPRRRPRPIQAPPRRLMSPGRLSAWQGLRARVCPGGDSPASGLNTLPRAAGVEGGTSTQTSRGLD